MCNCRISLTGLTKNCGFPHRRDEAKCLVNCPSLPKRKYTALPDAPLKDGYKLFLVFFLLLNLTVPQLATAQETSINWLTFEQLEDSLAIQPKKVFISFYADWCVYCKKMDVAAFKNKEVVSKLNKHYYAVKMNAQTQDTIVFEGTTLTNRFIGKSRNPIHDMALLLASREEQPFSLPAMVVLNEKFQIKARYFNYLSPKALQEVLERHLQ